MYRVVVLGLMLALAALLATLVKAPSPDVVISSTPSSEDEVEVVVLERGRQSTKRYVVTVAGVELEPRRAVAERGRAVVKLGQYSRLLADIAARHGYRPVDVEFGVLVIIERYDINQTHIIVERMFTTAPLIPDKPKKVKIEVEFKPQKTAYRKSELIQQVQTQSNPPPFIPDNPLLECPPTQPPPPENPYAICFGWELAHSQRIDNYFIPTAVAYLSPADSARTHNVDLQSVILINQQTGYKVTLPLVLYRGGPVILPAGFSFTQQRDAAILSAGCRFRRDTTTECIDRIRDTYQQLPPFSPGSSAVMGVGFLGTGWYVRYNYVFIVYEYVNGQWQIRSKSVRESADGIWIVPHVEYRDGAYRFVPFYKINSQDLEWIVALYNMPYTRDPPFDVRHITYRRASHIMYISVDGYTIVSSAQTTSLVHPYLLPVGGMVCVVLPQFCPTAMGLATTIDVARENSAFLAAMSIVSAEFTCRLDASMVGFTLRTFFGRQSASYYVPTLFVHVQTSSCR